MGALEKCKTMVIFVTEQCKTMVIFVTEQNVVH